MHAKCYFPKSAFSEQLHKLVKVQSSLRNSVVLFYMRSDVFYQSSSFFRNWIIQDYFFLLTIISNFLMLWVDNTISRAWWSYWSCFMQFLRVIQLLTRLKTIVINVDPQIFSLSVCIYHQLNSWHFNLWIVLNGNILLCNLTIIFLI